MNDINQNSKRKTKKQIKRFVIVPLKKPLAKFLIADFSFFSEEENRTKIYGIANWFERLQTLIINESFLFIFNGYRILNIENREDYKATFYTYRSKLPAFLEHYINKDYSLVKFTFNVKPERENNLDKNIDEKIILLNQLANNIWITGIFGFIAHQKTFKEGKGIEIVFSIAGFKEQELKKTTFKRYYYKWKQTANEHNTLKHSDKKLLTDLENFSIISKRLDDNYSYSKIAEITGMSKTKIINTCRNPDVLRFYHNVKRYSDNIFDYFSK